MTIEEASNKFNLTKDEITAYERKGYIESKSGEYTEQDFRIIGMVRTLISAGMSEKEISKYIAMLKESSSQNKQINLLRKFRAELLEHIHAEQQALDHIDYLIYQTSH